MSDERRETSDECNGRDARCPSGDEFDLTPPEVPVPDRLDFLAAELPEEYEGPWIVKLVRSFGGARGAGMDVLEDLFQTACAAAAKATEDAVVCGGDVTAFVKTAVRSALAKANRSFDMFAAHVDYAEDGPRGEDANPHERLIEQFADAKYRPSRRRKVDAVRLAALLVSPPVQAYWRAFRKTDGTDRAVARFLGVGRYGNLTTEEIEEFRAAQADPDGSKWEREHAGEVVGLDPLELNGYLFVEFPPELSLEESLEILRKIVGARTITADRLWWIARHKLIDKEMEHDR